MKIVFVNLVHNQQYIFDNIENLKRFGNTDIVVITDEQFRSSYEAVNVETVAVESLIPEYTDYIETIRHNHKRKCGFWDLCKYRFKVICKYMETHNVTNIVHLENDVMLFENLDNIKFHCTNKILLTLDNTNRCIPGLMFIPSYKIMKTCLNRWTADNDMLNWGFAYNKHKDSIDIIPIIKGNIHSLNDFSHFTQTHWAQKPDYELVSKNNELYDGIFDAAAIGQYLGGIHRNKTAKRKFINESCTVNYSQYEIIWKLNDKDLKCPFIIIDDKEVPIYNLHVHSKDLKQFM